MMITTQKIPSEKAAVMVIGGAGFIGSFLCESLLLQNSRVVCLDNLSTGKKENLQRCLKNSDFVFKKVDLRKFFGQYGPGEVSHIFHLTGSAEGLKNLLNLTQKTGAKLLVAGSSKDPWLKNLVKDYPLLDIRVVLFESTYGPRQNLNRPDSIGQLIKMAIKKENLPLVENNLAAFRPTFVSDIVYGLTKAMFAGGMRGRVINLSQAESGINWQPKVDLATGLKQTLEFFTKKRKLLTRAKSLPRRKIGAKFWLILLTIFLLLLMPYVFLLSDCFLALRNLRKSYQAVLIADSFQAAVFGKKTEELFSRAANESRHLPFTAKGEPYLLLGKELASGLTHAGLLESEANNLLAIVFQGGEMGQTLTNIKTELSEIYFHLSAIESGLRILPSFKPLNSLREKNTSAREIVLQAQKASQILPWVLGLEKKRTFLILLQNNHELRPTGGFIGSIALITFEKGKLIDFEVQDVYWADGQLKGHVEPPPELKKYLGEANWYLRDSNWSPDYPTSALRAKWFLEKETGRVVDGVLATDLFFIQELLQATGEIELTDFKEKISDQNLFERAEYYAEIGFFPGSTQKQDFLGALSRALFEELKNNDGETWTKIFKAFSQSLKTKDLLIYLTDSQAMKIISQLGWDGSIQSPSCLSVKDCLADYLMLVEANVGVNKANFFVKRAIDQQIKISPNGVIEENLKISYQNESPSETFPGGVYRNYLRLLTPLGTSLVKASLSGEEIPLSKIETSEISAKSSFGFLVEIGPGEKKLLELIYRLGPKITLKEKTQYLFFLQKQPGLKTESIRVQVFPPEEIKILPVRPTAIYQDGGYIFTPIFNQDLVLEMYLIK
jgi:hypothetical protein